MLFLQNSSDVLEGNRATLREVTISHKTVVEKQTWNRVILRIIDTTLNIGQNFRLKDKQKTVIKYGVVCRLTCSCGSRDIRQTGRNLIN